MKSPLGKFYQIHEIDAIKITTNKCDNKTWVLVKRSLPSLLYPWPFQQSGSKMRGFELKCRFVFPQNPGPPGQPPSGHQPPTRASSTPNQELTGKEILF